MPECAVCGDQLPEPAPTGRPARYCGEGCRRTREFEIRGVLRRIAKAEDAEQAARFDLDDPHAFNREGAEHKAKWWAAEVDRLRGRLQQLVSA